MPTIRPYKHGTGRFRVEYDSKEPDFLASIEKVLNQFYNEFPEWKPMKLILGGDAIKRYSEGAFKAISDARAENLQPATKTRPIDDESLHVEYESSSVLVERSYDLDDDEAMIAAHRRK